MDIWRLLLALSLALSISGISWQPKTSLAEEYNTPPEIKRCMEQDQLKDFYEIERKINPFYLRGDFDGDNKLDYSVRIRRVHDSKKASLFVGVASENRP